MPYEILIFLCLLPAPAILFILFAAFRRLTATVAEQRAALANLREAYKDLEATKPLRELGQSVAFINHEIKNYMVAISGCASLLQMSKNLDERDREMVSGIVDVAAKLQDLSLSVLELSKSNITHENREFDITEMPRACVERYFPKQARLFDLRPAVPQGGIIVNGSPDKFERVFINAFRNSFEAGAQKVSVRQYVYNHMALTVIEDDGPGCSAGQLKNFFTTFYSTKHGAGGTGLGLCVVRSIVETHNGNISIYSKNLLGGGSHGLSMQIAIPTNKKTAYRPVNASAMLVKEGFRDASAVLRTLKNLKTIPHLSNTQKGVDLDNRSASITLAVIAAPQQAADLAARAKGKAGIKILAIEETESGALIAVNNGRRDLFTEEYIANYLCEENHY